MKKKIIVSANSTWNIFNFRLGLISRLKQEYDIIILASELDEYSQNLKELGFEIVNFKINPRGKGILDNLFLIYRYWLILKKYKPDFFLPFTIKPNIFGSIVCRLLNIKTINNITGLGNSFIENIFLEKLVLFLYKFSLKKSVIVFFHNEKDKKLFLNKNIILENNCTVIPGSGINLSKFNFQKLNFNKEFFDFIYVGRMITDKGILILLDVINNLSKYKNIRFKLIGSFDKSDKNYSKIFKNIVYNKSFNFEFIPFTNDIKKYIIKSDCLILPSYREGLPRSLLEASALGTPIIASNVPGCNDLITDGYNGLLFNDLTVPCLTKKILEFTNLDYENREKLSKNARLNIEKNYDEKIVIKRYIDYLDK